MTRNDALRKARMQRHWTQSTLATQLNTTRVTVVRWEQGKASPSLYFREQLCQLFGMTEQALGLEPLPIEPGQQSIWLVPEIRNAFFTGRELLLQQLHAVLRRDEEAVPTGIHLLSGLAGMGKTQVALEYAYRFRQDYTIIAWVRAETPETLREDVSTLARALHIPHTPEQEAMHVVPALKRWLETHKNWLLIFDHVEDLAHVSHILPAHHAEGNVLITTRLQATGHFSHLHLAEMSSEESMLLLLRRAKLFPTTRGLAQIPTEERAVVAQLCQALGGLPLALDQAGAYIEETGCSVAGYLERFKCRRTALLSWRGQQNDGYPHSVSMALQIARERVERQSLVADELLSLCLFLHPDTIPETVITSSTMHLGEHIKEAVYDLLSLDEAFAVLNASALLRRDPETHLLTMHGLVQTVLRDQLGAERQRLWLERALQALLHLFPASPYHEVARWPLCDLLLPHVVCCIGHVEDLAWGEQQIRLATLGSALLFKAVAYLLERTRYGEAEPFFARALHLLETTLEPGHPLLDYPLPKRMLLSKVLGEYPQAEELFLRVFTLWEQTYGSAYPALSVEKQKQDLSVPATA